MGYQSQLGPLALDGVDDGPPQHLRVDTTLDQVVLGTRRDRGNSEMLVIQPGEHDDRDGGIEFAQAVKGVELGDGFDGAGRRGSEAHDAIVWDAEAGEYRRTSARAGGLEGGMTTGEVLVAHVAMKPLATLNRPVLATVDTATKESTASFKERTDVTAVPAMGVVAEAMTALVLANEALRKFGGDSVDELLRNADAFRATLP